MRSNQDNLVQSSKKPAHKGGMLSEVDLKILWVSRTLTNIDFEYAEELLKLERSQLHKDLKASVRDVIISKYRERRQPYADLLKDLRQQHRQSLAA